MRELVSEEIFENGDIRVTRVLYDNNNEYTYIVTLDDFSQLILRHNSFENLKELMVAFSDQDSLPENILQAEFDWEIQEGEYG
jgi:hypothetical protein